MKVGGFRRENGEGCEAEDYVSVVNGDTRVCEGRFGCRRKMNGCFGERAG